jgi:hypothetical protein
MIAAFVWWEGRFAYPLMPMKIWRDREFSLVYAVLSEEMIVLTFFSSSSSYYLVFSPFRPCSSSPPCISKSYSDTPH